MSLKKEERGKRTAWSCYSIVKSLSPHEATCSMQPVRRWLEPRARRWSPLGEAGASLRTHQWSLAQEAGSIEIRRKSAGGEHIL